MYYKISLLILIYIIYRTVCNKKTHAFWSKQPVSRDFINNEGLIGINPIFTINLTQNKFYELINIKLQNEKAKLIFQFINEHFSDNYNYSNQFLYESLLYLDNDIKNICLYINNKLIGFIHAKPIIIYIEQKQIHVYYVDFLCIHKKYRGKNLAIFLIAKLINLCNEHQIFLFKKEIKSLPFNYINDTSYYYIDVSFLEQTIIHNKIKFMEDSDIDDVYQFIISNQKQTQLYQFLTLAEFKKLYKKTSKQILIEYNNNTITCIIIYIEILFMQGLCPVKTYDIENIYINNHIRNYEIFDFLINDAKRNNIKTISLINQYHNK